MAEPEPESLFDMPPDEAVEARLDAEAIADLDAGNAVPHERVREWLLRRIGDAKVPPPVE